MADVFLARDLLLDRLVAIKVLFPEFATDPNFVERFRREAQSAANLTHPNIVAVYDWGKYANTYFMAMEYVQGRTLADILPRKWPRQFGAGRGDRQRGCRGTGQRARQRRRAPRHQAGEHPHRRQRPGEGRRLRHCAGDERSEREQPHSGRLGDGHRHLLLARAGARCSARSTQRSVFARHRVVRDGGGQAALRRREPGQHRVQAGPRSAAAPEPVGRRRASTVRGDRRQVAGQGSELALPQRRRAARGPPQIPQRRACDGLGVRGWRCIGAAGAHRRHGGGGERHSRDAAHGRESGA